MEYGPVVLVRLSDPEVLALVARGGRVMVTHDQKRAGLNIVKLLAGAKGDGAKDLSFFQASYKALNKLG